MDNLQENMINFALTFMVICVMIMIIALTLSTMKNQLWDYYVSKCNELNGTLVTYECYNTPLNNGFCDLDTTKTGQWCSLLNGTEIDLTIREVRV